MSAPGEADLRSLMVRADEALVGLRAITDEAVPTPAAERGLGRLSAALFDALAAKGSWADFRDALDRGRAGVVEALGALQDHPSPDPEVGRSLRRAAWILRELGHVRPPVTDEPGPLPPPEVPLRASLARPRLLCPPRGAITAGVPLPERSPLEAVDAPAVDFTPLPPGAASAAAVLAQALADAEAPTTDPPPPPEPEPPAVATDDLLFGVAVDEGEQLRRRARELTEELGSMGRMRRHDDTLPWRHGLETERRLLTRVDALVAIGDVAFTEVVRQLEERPFADPELAWAHLLLYGSVGGQDTAAGIYRLLGLLELDDPDIEDYGEVIADALTHAPHPAIRALLAPWLESADAARRRVAHAALGRRRELSLEEMTRGLDDPDADVVVHSLRAVALMEGRVHPSLLYAPLRDARPPVIRAAMITAIAHGYEVGLRTAINRCQHGLAAEAGSAMIVAVAGADPEARRVLLDAVEREPAAVTYRALGWYGHVDGVEPLLKGLADEDEATARAAWAALERITGAELLGSDVEPEYPEDDRPFLRATSRPTTIPSEEGCWDPDAWRAWLQAHGRVARADVRYRFGRPWAPADSVIEMRHPISTQAIRLYDHLELCARTAGRIPFEPHAFLARQDALLGLWDAHLERVERTLGKWPVRFVG